MPPETESKEYCDQHTMEVTEKQPTLLEQSVAVAPWIHVTQIRLSNSSIQSSNPSEGVTRCKLQHTFDATTILDREQAKLTVNVHLTMSVEAFVKILAEYIIEFTVADTALDLAEKFGTAFGKITGVFAVWPYWREYVQTTSNRLGLPPITLPLITSSSMVAYYAEKEKKAVDKAAS